MLCNLLEFTVTTTSTTNSPTHLRTFKETLYKVYCQEIAGKMEEDASNTASQAFIAIYASPTKSGDAIPQSLRFRY